MAKEYPGKLINPIIIIDYKGDTTINLSCKRLQNHENIGCSSRFYPILLLSPRASNLLAATGIQYG
jgi:hypothetical protein